MALEKSLQTSLILRTVSGVLSMIGSASILYLIYLDRNTKKKDTKSFYAIMGVLSFFDIFYSACYPLNWWSALKAPDNGTICNFIGFTFVTSQASTYYNASLCIYYVLVICLSKTQEWISKWAMPPLLLVPILYSLLSASIAAGLHAYGWNGFGCWFEGEYAEVLSNFVAGWTPVIIALVIVIGCMGMIIRSVYLIEKKILSYGSPQQQGRSTSITEQMEKMKKTKQLAYEAILFIGAFLSSYIWFPMIAAMINGGGRHLNSEAVTMGYSFCAPLQGFWNFLIFYRRYLMLTGRAGRPSGKRSSKSKSSKGSESARKAAYDSMMTKTQTEKDHTSTGDLADSSALSHTEKDHTSSVTMYTSTGDFAEGTEKDCTSTGDLADGGSEDIPV